MELQERFDLISKPGTQEVLEILKDFLNGSQQILFSVEDTLADESLREVVGGCKFCVKMLRAIDPEFELSEDFIKRQLNAIPMEEPKEQKIPEDVQSLRGMPGMRPNAY